MRAAFNAVFARVAERNVAGDAEVAGVARRFDSLRVRLERELSSYRPRVDVAKPTAESRVGYRVKEVLFGQKAEGVGQTNAITGTLTIVGTNVSAVELTADLTTLASDESRRPGPVLRRRAGVAFDRDDASRWV